MSRDNAELKQKCMKGRRGMGSFYFYTYTWTHWSSVCLSQSAASQRASPAAKASMAPAGPSALLGAEGLIFVREAVGGYVNLLFTCLSQPAVLIAVSGSREPNCIIIPASFAGCVSSGHWAPKRRAKVVYQPSNLPWMLASRHLENWCIKQVKRFHFLRTFFSFWQSSVSRLSEQEFASRLWWINDELNSKCIYHTLEIFLLWISPLLKQTSHFSPSLAHFPQSFQHRLHLAFTTGQYDRLLQRSFQNYLHGLNWWVKAVPLFSI